MVDLKRFEMEALEIHADHLNGLCAADPRAKIFYDIISDALVWSDEQLESTSIEIVCSLRQLRHYRTQLMINDAEPDNEVWRYCHSLFPDWVGFLPERRKPTPKLLAIYRRGDISMRWCLRKIEREFDAK